MIQRTKLRKAPAPGRTTNKVLRHLPQRSIAAMTRLFNGILRTGHFPYYIRESSAVSSWYPNRIKHLALITLLRTIPKVFEVATASHDAPPFSHATSSLASVSTRSLIIRRFTPNPWTQHVAVSMLWSYLDSPIGICMISVKIGSWHIHKLVT